MGNLDLKVEKAAFFGINNNLSVGTNSGFKSPTSLNARCTAVAFSLSQKANHSTGALVYKNYERKIFDKLTRLTIFKSTINVSNCVRLENVQIRFIGVHKKSVATPTPVPSHGPKNSQP